MKEAIDELNKLLNESYDLGEKVKNPIMPLTMDLCDFGNAVGIVVQKLIERDPTLEMSDFYSGFKHGVSLIDGTHG